MFSGCGFSLLSTWHGHFPPTLNYLTLLCYASLTYTDTLFTLFQYNDGSQLGIFLPYKRYLAMFGDIYGFDNLKCN